MPLSDFQQEIWLATRLGDAASCAFNFACSIEICQHVDSRMMQMAFEELVARHEALRAVVVRDGSHQLIRTPIKVEIEEQTVPASQHAAVRARFVSRPFDLEAGPLVRALLIQRMPEHHEVVVAVHQLAADSHACVALMQELMALYAFHAELTFVRPESATMQLSDWVHLRGQSDPRRSAAEAYWQSQLAAPPVVELRPDATRPGAKTFAADQVRLMVGAKTTRALRELAARHDVSLHALAMAAWHVYLHRVTGEQDVLSGHTVSAQSTDGGLVANRARFLPVRSHPTPEQTFSQHLRMVGRAMAEAVDHRSLSFGQILKGLRLPRDASRAPLVGMAVDWEGARTSVSLGDQSVSVNRVRPNFENLDLHIRWEEDQDSLSASCSFNVDLFDPEMMNWRMQQYLMLLTEIAHAPDVKLCDLALRSEEERELVERWNQTRADHPLDKDVFARVELQAQETPNATAVVFDSAAGTSERTYAELIARARHIGRSLVDLGLGSGDLVGVCVERTIELPELLLGIVASGAAYVPMSPSLPAMRLQQIVEDAQPKLIVADESLRGLFESDETSLSLRVVTPHFVDTPRASLPTSRDPERLAYAIFTSGSTGRPKGVAIEHRSLSNLLAAFARRPGLRPSDRMLAVTTISFDISAIEIFLPLVLGASLEVVPARVAANPEHLARRLASASHMQATPTTWRMLLASGWAGDRRLHIWSGGEPLAADLSEILVKRCAELWNFYGPTETTVWSSIDKVDGTSITIGRPIDNTSFHVLDQDLRDVPLGVVGELYIGGVGVAREYLGRPDLTAERFIEVDGDRLYRTGDQGRWRADGRLECHGRIDRQVKIRGFRIELEEIESVARKHPQVEEIVVVARDFGGGDRRLCGYYVSNEEIAPRELQEFLRRELPAYMVPASFDRLSSVPLNPSGKVDYRALPAPAVSSTSGALVGPRNELEAAFREVFQRLLQVSDVSVTDDFFQLGGHSLLGVRLVSELSEVAGTAIPLQTLYRDGSIRGLAAALSQDALDPVAAGSQIIALNDAMGSSPLYCICGVHLYSRLAARIDRPVYGVFLPVELHLISGRGTQRLPSVEEMASMYIDAIRLRQPNGPYHVLGISFGGVLAFEIARQLRESGADVRFVGLVDAVLPRAVRRDIPLTLVHQLKRIREEGWRSWAEHVVTRLRGAGGSAPQRYDDPELMRIEDLRERAYAEATDRYDSGEQTYGGDVTLFAALDRSDFPGFRVHIEPPWQRRVQGGLTVHHLPGGHLASLDEPHVDELARLVGCYLDKCD